MFSDQFVEDLVAKISDCVFKRVESRLAPAWPRWMPIEIAAKYIGHTPRSFTYLLSKNLFPVVRRDRLVLVDREDLDRALTRLKQ